MHSETSPEKSNGKKSKKTNASQQIFWPSCLATPIRHKKNRAALADEATQVPCEPLAIARRPAPPPAPPPTRAHRHRFCLTPEPPAGPPPPPDAFARVVYEEPAELPDRDVVAV